MSLNRSQFVRGAISVLLLLGATPCPAQEKVVFDDHFDGKLGEGWSWIRENKAHWCVREGALEIRAMPGLADTVRNALVRKAPDRRRGTFAIELTVTNLAKPTKQYEQAGLTWYRGGKPVFKLVMERVDGQVMIIPGQKRVAGDSVQLRLVVSAEEYTAQYRTDAKSEFKTAAAGKLPPPGADQISIQCYHGPPNQDHWIRFDDFRVLELNDGKSSDNNEK